MKSYPLVSLDLVMANGETLLLFMHWLLLFSTLLTWLKLLNIKSIAICFAEIPTVHKIYLVQLLLLLFSPLATVAFYTTSHSASWPTSKFWSIIAQVSLKIGLMKYFRLKAVKNAKKDLLCLVALILTIVCFTCWLHSPIIDAYWMNAVVIAASV